ncbi:MAG: biotin/lipoyl-binding protein [Oscillospiraceae bacterium]|nr:biotin/lipoyl-binding protein [Oscillospiraceae bacterium]
MKYKITLNDKTYEVEVERGVAQIVDEYAYVAAAPAAPAPAAPAAAAAGEKVTSPMPGTILNVLVKQGDTVKEGQNLLVLEAMKMENEVLAPVSGTVAQLCVAKGASVNTGDLLLVIG